MCRSSWKLYLDDFPFFVSSLAHLEPELELFEVWELLPLAMMMICHTSQLQTALARVLDELKRNQKGKFI